MLRQCYRAHHLHKSFRRGKCILGVFQSRVFALSTDHFCSSSDRYRQNQDSSSDLIQNGYDSSPNDETKKTMTRKKRTFVPFFEEIDAIMEERYPERYRKKNTRIRKSKLSSIFEEAASASKDSLLESNITNKIVEVASDLNDTSKGHNSEESFLSQENNVPSPIPSTEEELKKEIDVSSCSPEQLTEDASDDPQPISSTKTKKQISIFDSFVIPEESSPQLNTNAFNTKLYDEYSNILEEIFKDKQFHRKHTKKPLLDEVRIPVEDWMKRDEKALECKIPIFDQAMKVGIQLPMSDKKRSQFRKECDLQKEKFLQYMEMNDSHHHVITGAFKSFGNKCAKQARSLPLEIAWQKVKEAGIILDQKSLTAYLYASTTYGGTRGGLFDTARKSSIRNDSVLNILGRTTTKADDNEYGISIEDDDAIDVAAEVATFHDLLYEPTEKSLTVRVRSLVACGDAKGAEELIDNSSAGVLRQRTYLPVLQLYLEQCDINAGLKVFKKMKSLSTVHLEPETYVQLISAIAEAGYFSPNAKPIEDAEQIGYSPSSGPRLFDQIASQMGEDCLEITAASARQLYAAFTNSFKEHSMGRNLKELLPLTPLASVNETAATDELVASRVTVAPETGICPRTAAKLRLIGLEERQRKQLHESLLELSKTAFQEFTQKFAKQKVKSDNFAAEKLLDFASWMDTRKGQPFTAIVDAANVAYYMQNFETGRFNYYQIQFMVDKLEKMNENPLVILPYKYSQRFFHYMKGSRSIRHELTENEINILKSLTNSGRLYTVPKSCLDDYYWMLASVSDQIAARKGTDLTVAPGDSEGRWAGARPMIITNDQMRDHRLELMEPRPFRRWASNHIVNYSFTAFVDDECLDEGISFSPADFFSREIQGNPTNLDKENDSGEAAGATAWHFPVSDWELNERFCIRIPDL